MIISDLTPVLPHMRAGTLRPLAGTRLARSSLIPDVHLERSRIRELRPPFTGRTVRPGKHADARCTPANGDLRRIIDNSETRMRLAAVGFEGFSSTPAELGETAAVQLAKWTPMIRDAGIEAEQPPGRSHQIAA